jgi:hypothetical protein
MSDWRATARQRLPRLAPQLYSAAVTRARLTVVPRPDRQAPRTPFVVLVATVLLAGVVGLLLFNTHMQQGSFRATALELRATELHATQQSLEMELDRLRDPQQVAAAAQRLGMVPLANPAFLSLADGRTLGQARPASRLDAQRLTPLPTRKPADYRPPVRRVPWDAAASTIDSPQAGAPALGAAATPTAPAAGTDAQEPGDQ